MNPIDQAILQDEIRRALNGLFLNGQVGRTHIAKSSLFFDGDATGKITVPGSLIGMADDTVFAKMMDRAIEENEIDGITLYLNGESTYHEKSELTFEETFGATIIKWGDISSAVAVQESAVDVLGVESGTYLMTNGKYYTSEIRGVLTETIVPIDPKFIPGAVLPVVEIDITDDFGDNEGAPPVEVQAQLNVAAEQGTVAVLKMTDGSVPKASYILTFMVNNDGTVVYVNVDVGQFTRGTDGTWTCAFV